jgi:glycosyltransferase involved in cell wall biosynthesis
MASVQARGLGRAVDYLGPKRIEDIARAIEDCDVGIIPNRRSLFTELNTPTRIFEYLALGKPVIAPRAAGIRDYFDDDALVYFELGDAADLARRIEHVWAHPHDALEVVRRGQAVYRAHTWRREREAFLRQADGLLSGPGRRA